MTSYLSVLFLTSLCWQLSCFKEMKIHLDGQTKVCGSIQTIMKDSQATIVAKGNLPGASCVMKFTTADTTGVCSVCFEFEKYAFFNSTLASISIKSGPMSKLIDSTDEFIMSSVCTQSASMNLTLTHDVGYVYDPKEPGYSFMLDIFNECGYRGQSKSLSFSDVVDHATGYHHGEEKTNRETQTMVTGLVVGISLACVFLIILLIAYCYVKNSPNRGSSKSAGMPRGAKKSMDVRAEQGTNKPDVEMVAYKSKEAGRPEGKPLLTAGAAAVLGQKEDKKSKKKERKDSGSSVSSASSHDHVDQPDEKKVLIEETPAPPEPSSDTHTTSAGENGYGGGSSDYTSSGAGGGSSGVGSSDYSSGGGYSAVGSSDYSSGGGYSGGGFSGGSDYSSGGGGGGGGGDYSSGGGGGSDD